MVMTDERLFTVDEVAEKLRMKPGTVRNWLRTGRLKGFTLGKTQAGWRVRESELQRFIEAAERGELED